MTTDKPVDHAISARTRKALSEAKARGVQLGRAGADNLRATVEKRKSTADAFAQQHEALFAELQARGLTHRAMATELNARGIAAARGGEWTHGQVQRILNRYADLRSATPSAGQGARNLDEFKHTCKSRRKVEKKFQCTVFYGRVCGGHQTCGQPAVGRRRRVYSLDFYRPAQLSPSAS